MDILILNWKDVKNPEVGGAEIIAFEFARRLTREGHTVTFLSRGFRRSKKKEIIDGVKILRFGNKLTVYFHAFLYYKSLLKKPDFVIDMINTICWQTPLYVPAEKRVAYINQLAKEVFFYEFPWPLSIISYYLERFEYMTYRNTKFLCYSESTKDDLIKFGVSAVKINIFPLGLDHKRYTKSGRKSTKPLFIFVARLVKMKRGDLCIQAMQEVVSKFPAAQLALIGNGPDEDRLQKMIFLLHLEKNVIIVNKNNFYIDKQKGDLKVDFMRRAWVLLLPSVKEGWGMVVTEAAACGTPSIVSDVTGLRDSVRRNKTGIILSSSPSEKELSQAMIKLIKNTTFRINLSKEAVVWSKNFDWDGSYEKFKHALGLS